MTRHPPDDIGTSLGTEAKELGEQAFQNRLSTALSNPVVADCLNELYDQYGSNSGNYQYKTQNEIVTGTEHSAASLKNQFKNDSKFDFWGGNHYGSSNEGFGSLAHLNLVELRDHFGEYRILPTSDYRDYVTTEADLENRLHPTYPPRKDKRPELHFESVRSGLGMLSHTDRSKFESINDGVPGVYDKPSPTEVDIACDLERELGVWLEELSFEEDFHDRSRVDFTLGLAVLEVDGKPIENFDPDGLSELLDSLDLMMISELAIVAKPVFLEVNTSISCDCRTTEEHIARSASKQFNSGLFSQFVLEEKAQDPEFWNETDNCRKAHFSDELKKTDPYLMESGALGMQYTLVLDSLEFTGRGGRSND